MLIAAHCARHCSLRLSLLTPLITGHCAHHRTLRVSLLTARVTAQVELLEKIYIFLRRALGTAQEFSLRSSEQLLSDPRSPSQLRSHADDVIQQAKIGGIILCQYSIRSLRAEPSKEYLEVFLPLVSKLIYQMRPESAAEGYTVLTAEQCIQKLAKIEAEHGEECMGSDCKCTGQCSSSCPVQSHSAPASFGLAFSGGGVRASAQVVVLLCAPYRVVVRCRL